MWQSYCDTIDELDPGSPIKRTNRLSSVDDDLDALPLPEGVLTTNLGLDVVVVVTKVRVPLFSSSSIFSIYESATNSIECLIVPIKSKLVF